MATETENQIVVYQPNETVRLDVRLENETVWLNRHQMAQLFGRDIKTVGKHIANALREELNDNILQTSLSAAVVAKFATTASDGKTYQVEYYSLDMILSVGYRVKSAEGILFRRWANTVLKEYLLRGYSVNARMNQLEDKMDRRLCRAESDIADLKDKVDFFVQTQTPPLQGVFYEGQLWDACSLVEKLIGRAKKTILLIDSWVGPGTLDILAKKRKGVSVDVVASPRGNKLVASDIAKFNAQYGGLSVKTSKAFHDRFLIIDDKELYLIGASLKDLGRKCFGFTKMDSGEVAGIKARL
jgi:hypothetical protein